MDNKKSISIIICCYNSSARIEKTLDYIHLVNIPNEYSLEVILVDNASTDSTALVAENKWKTFNSHIDLTIVHQPIPGLSFARSIGIEKATGEWVMFCDDDNYLSSNYIVNALNLANSYSNVGIIGGQGIAEFEGNEPKNWKDIECWYACGNLQPNSGEIDAVNGACMMIKRQIFSEPHFQIPFFLTDRLGNDLISGGDLEICKRAKLAGYTVIYSQESTYGHFMPTARLTNEYLMKLLLGIGKGFMLLRSYDKKIISPLKEGLRFIYGILRLFFLKSVNTWGLKKAEILLIRYNSLIFYFKCYKQIVANKNLLKKL